MIQVKMADPDCIEVWPIELFLSHPVWRVGADIKQQRAAGCVEPECRRCTARMRNRRAGTEDGEFHVRYLMSDMRLSCRLSN